jgi:hypothetical protein
VNCHLKNCNWAWVQDFATNAGFGQAREIAGDGNFMKVLAFQKEAVAAA